MKNMMLINSAFRNMASFSMIPVTDNCPYVEVIFDPSTNSLIAFSKTRKEIFKNMPRLNDDGDFMKVKTPNKETGRTYKEIRMRINVFSDYILTDEEDIDNFISLFSINESFDYKKYFSNQEIQTSKIITGV